jgi:hypothetical protein
LYYSPELDWHGLYSELGERETNADIQRRKIMGTDQLEGII